MLIAILIGALLGYQLGRVPGMIAGIFLAIWLARKLKTQLRSGIAQVQTQFLESTFAVMGAMCKADGSVSRDEIKVAEALFDKLRLSAQQRDIAKAAFGRGKSADFDLDAELDNVKRVTRGQSALIQMFLQVQLSAVAADGEMHPAEHEMLIRIGRRLGLPDAEIRRLEAMFRGARGAGGGASTQSQLDDAYEVLGVASDVSDAELKRAYRRLMSQNHPDKLASKGLPDSMREMAEQKTREISHAYDIIKRARDSA
ncbi:co-chaperone DjlA [Hydrocarboniclastica marina]|uniref:Co-chaperone DjlA n=1 Tax=Hydrocarboniclastica marina TaxID=2259620 RepID=A0A4P7XD12_9ALTE|nr:co-chaperone DjlA [Hydrocarboniclastica marina]QCF24749.1 co-chaperone DjlA [Hydrocarboniclastica marina]